MKAIPPDLALEYNKKHNEKQSQVTDLTTYLRGEVESRERTEFLLKPHGSNSYPNNIRKEHHQSIRSQIERVKVIRDPILLINRGNGDEEILSEFDKSVCFVDGRYRVSLPWKPGMREVLPNNKTVARKRFEGLVRRFECDHELFCEYKDVIDNYVREGIVERTSCDSLSDSQGFLPTPSCGDT
ncbi:uncharacterized protein TNCT_203161 [Trichonephila clavata]|uniref:Uncharacterized protein n=1 Tax=Trichonephila clavata TaxID=2740835 RepID=A0A8X6G403_TRICU|nr:uncharacterized protein TNCT_203161 [Trichonephila clavata]